MKQRTFFECEFCGATYLDQAECESCEAKHFGLTRKEYLDWRMFCKEAARAGIQLGIRRDKNTTKKFDDAVELLVDFEKAHGIKPDCEKPTDFYF